MKEIIEKLNSIQADCKFVEASPLLKKCDNRQLQIIRENLRTASILIRDVFTEVTGVE